MPIFEYSCRDCDHRFETIVLSPREKVSCPKCDSRSVEKQLSVFSSPVSVKESSQSTGGGCACPPILCPVGYVTVPNVDSCCFHCESACNNVACPGIACASGSHLEQAAGQRLVLEMDDARDIPSARTASGNCEE
jgi:putative FmdB family regulatory protein